MLQVPQKQWLLSWVLAMHLYWPGNMWNALLQPVFEARARLNDYVCDICWFGVFFSFICFPQICMHSSGILCWKMRTAVVMQQSVIAQFSLQALTPTKRKSCSQVVWSKGQSQPLCHPNKFNSPSQPFLLFSFQKDNIRPLSFSGFISIIFIYLFIYWLIYLLLVTWWGPWIVT